MQRRINLTFIFFMIFFSCNAQISKEAILEQISLMDTLNQHCIDEGNNFIGCSDAFYDQMDSMLNAVYKLIKKKSDTATFRQVRQEQLKWLVKRDKYFKEVDVDYLKNLKENGMDEADRSLDINNKAEFVEDRIKELLKKWYVYK